MGLYRSKVWKTPNSSTYLQSQTNSAFCILHSAFKSFRTQTNSKFKKRMLSTTAPQISFILHFALCILHCAAGALIPHSAFRTPHSFCILHSAFCILHSAFKSLRITHYALRIISFYSSSSPSSPSPRHQIAFCEAPRGWRSAGRVAWRWRS